MSTKKPLPVDKDERRRMATVMKFWVICPSQEPFASEAAKFILKLCKIAVSKYFPSCPYDDRYDLEMDIFRAMWANLPGVYDPAKCPEEVNVMWLLTRCRLYATGMWSAGYGQLGCKYTRARVEIARMRNEYAEDMKIIYGSEHPEAVSHRVDTSGNRD